MNCISIVLGNLLTAIIMRQMGIEFEKEKMPLHCNIVIMIYTAFCEHEILCALSVRIHNEVDYHKAL